MQKSGPNVLDEFRHLNFSEEKTMMMQINIQLKLINQPKVSEMELETWKLKYT
jgi:hypothetical protein